MVLLRQSRDASVGLRGGTSEADERVEEKVGGKEELWRFYLSVNPLEFKAIVSFQITNVPIQPSIWPTVP